MEPSPRKEIPVELFLVQGCGMSLICARGQRMLEWIDEILNRGGIPEITRLLSTDKKAAHE